MLSLNQVTLKLGQRLIFENLNVDFLEHQNNIILGPSGCGKSTVLRLMSGLLKPDTGQVNSNFEKIGFVFQEPRLLPWLSVCENIELPLRLRKHLIKDTEFWLKLVQMQDHSQKFPHELSGGMRMRVAIARALILEPTVLLMDEPFSALDEMRRQGLQDFLLELQLRLKFTLIFVTHSMSEAAFLADRISIMAPQKGHILKTLDFERTKDSISKKTRDDVYFQKVQSLSQIFQNILEAP